MYDMEYIPDCLFPSDNDVEIPSLRQDMQAQVCDIPFLCFGEQKRTQNMNGQGTVHFYTDDYRFNSVYEHPEKILQHNPRNIVEPNFSLFNETPIAYGLQPIYKKRWIARQMQEKGIRVFVDLNVAAKYYALNMLGVPLGYASFCTRGYSERIASLEMEYDIASRCANGNPLLFVVYGGGERCCKFAQEKGCVYVTPVCDLKRDLRKAKKLIGKNVATLPIFKDGSDLLPAMMAKVFNKQLLDYRENNNQEQISQF